ncbi:hypothetical protein [Amycolatopsis circi]|uniref:hypothetical protein n=1 Tax=Amycolatopsis circi TaxID=871959 RepID=UPI000E2613FA|nr:hypothetical protein [Amycolatopsis circi]
MSCRRTAVLLGTLAFLASDLSRTTEVPLGPGDNAWFFQPGTCALVVVSHTGDEDSYDHTVTLSDPVTGQQRSSRTLPIALGGDSGIREPAGGTPFVPSPTPGALAAAYADSNAHQLIVADLTTGGARRLDGPGSEATQVLGWTPARTSPGRTRPPASIPTATAACRARTRARGFAPTAAG